MVEGLRHWWRYTRLRLRYRQLWGWAAWWSVRLRAGFWAAGCRFAREKCVPLLVGMGEMSPREGLDASRDLQKNEDGWKAWGKERRLLGADKGHPEGIYAEGGSDLVCMTSDEYEHWYGGRGDSRGGAKGA